MVADATSTRRGVEMNQHEYNAGEIYDSSIPTVVKHDAEIRRVVAQTGKSRATVVREMLAKQRRS